LAELAAPGFDYAAKPIQDRDNHKDQQLHPGCIVLSADGNNHLY
jgi:hypothetical protein